VIPPGWAWAVGIFPSGLGEPDTPACRHGGASAPCGRRRDRLRRDHHPSPLQTHLGYRLNHPAGTGHPTLIRSASTGSSGVGVGARRARSGSASLPRSARCDLPAQNCLSQIRMRRPIRRHILRAYQCKEERSVERNLPTDDTMYAASLSRDTRFEGVFVMAVKTTGIFCRPSCHARKPKRENVEFFATPRDALAHGYRPCRVCRPLEPFGSTPEWIDEILKAVDSDPTMAPSDGELRARGVDPARLRRWFQKNHGMTFRAYLRQLRLNRAYSAIRAGGRVTDTAYEHGFESLSGFSDGFRRTLGIAPSPERQPPRRRHHRRTDPHAPRPDARRRHRRRSVSAGVCRSPYARAADCDPRTAASGPGHPGSAPVAGRVPGSDRRVFRRATTYVRTPAGSAGHAVSDDRLARARDDSLRRDAILRPTGRPDRASDGGTGRGPRQRRKPAGHRGAVPSRGWRQRRAHRLRRWPLAQAGSSWSSRALSGSGPVSSPHPRGTPRLIPDRPCPPSACRATGSAHAPGPGRSSPSALPQSWISSRLPGSASF
jgi:methylphosphotriester-DNA--protein-cysteine methyltransferase